MENYFPQSFPEFIELFYRRKYYFVVPFVCVIVTTVIAYPFLPRLYRSNALLLAEEGRITNPLDDEDRRTGSHIEKKIKALTAQVVSWTNLASLVRDLSLLPEKSSRDNLETMVKSMREHIEVSLRTGGLIDVTYEDRSAQRSQIIANAIAADLVKKNHDINIRVADDTIAFFDEQLHRYKEKLSASDSDYLSTRTREQLDEAIRHRNLIIGEHIRHTPTKSEVELANAEQELDRLLLDAKPSYPLVQELQKRVETLRQKALEQQSEPADDTPSDADQASQAARAEHDQQLRSVDAEIQDLRLKLRDVAKGDSRSPLNAQELSSMQRDQQVNSDIYRSLLLGLSNAQIKQKLETEGEQDRLLILDEARLPERPAKPDPFKILGLGLLAALGAGFLGLLAREYFDSSFRGVKDARQSLDLPFLGFISMFPFGDGKVLKNKNGVDEQDGLVLWPQHYPASVAAEQFRFLRTNLFNRTAEQKPLRSLLITSTLENEGKTTTAMNLAASIAIDLEKRVALVDLDLRHGSLSRLYSAIDKPGVADILEGRLALDQVIQPTSTNRLSLVPRGVASTHPGNIVSEQKVAPLLSELMNRFDFVVIDGPRISELADAVILSSLAEGTLFVVRTGTTRREQVEHALSALEATHRNAIVGYVLTHVATYGPSYVNPYFLEEA